MEKEEGQLRKYGGRESIFSDPKISFLLNSIKEPDVREFLINDFLRTVKGEYDPGKVNNGHLINAVRYFRLNSPISSAVMANPGTSIVTEMLYYKSPATELDKYFVMSNAGESIHNRFQSVVATVRKIAEGIVESKGEARIINLGSGPGTDTIHILKESDKRQHLHVTCVDIDRNAMKYGQSFAEHLGIGKNLKYQKADLREIVENPAVHKDLIGKYDVCMLIGIICPLSLSESRRTVNSCKNLLKNGGRMVTSAAHKRMKEDDPFTIYIMRRLGLWSLIYKTEDDLNAIYSDAGLKEPSFFYDEPRRHHMLAIGVAADTEQGAKGRGSAL